MAKIPTGNPTGLRLTWLGALAVLVIIGLMVMGGLTLAGWVNVPQGHFAIVMNKTGQDIGNQMLLAAGPDYKGVQEQVITEGYHFYNPYSYWVSDPIPATVVPEGNVAIVTRKYGDALAPGQVLATASNEKGILREPLLPGRHYLNTYAYGVEIVPMVKIEPGFVGVVTLLVGKTPEDSNVFVVKEGERGTQPVLLPPGTHPQYSNRWMYKVVPVDARSQKLEMSGEQAVDFLSEDGFPIHTEGTIEYALDQKKLPEMFVMFVDDTGKDQSGLKNIEEKLILPFGRSLYRIYGAQHKAVDYLTGSTRTMVQNQVERELREVCAKEGILIRSFVIRSTEPPRAIRQQYERRELAKRQLEQYAAEIVTEIGYPAVEGGKPKLDAMGQQVFLHGVPVVEGGAPKVDEKGNTVFEGGRLSKELQTRMKDRAEKLGKIRLEIADVLRAAEQYSMVEATKANQRLEVARLELQAADDLAASKTAAGEASAAVIRMKNQAQVAGIEATVEAFGSGDQYAQYLMTTRFAPAVKSIWSNTDGFFADIFRNLAQKQGAATQPGK